jgi:hypothetical protein
MVQVKKRMDKWIMKTFFPSYSGTIHGNTIEYNTPAAYCGSLKNKPLSNVEADTCDIGRSVGSGTCGIKDGFYKNQPRPCIVGAGDCDKGDTCKIPHQCTGKRYCAQVNDYKGICLNESQLKRQTKCHNVRKESSTFNDNGRQMYWFTSKNYYCASNDSYCK